jgi:hypothetical protein
MHIQFRATAGTIVAFTSAPDTRVRRSPLYARSPGEHEAVDSGQITYLSEFRPKNNICSACQDGSRRADVGLSARSAPNAGGGCACRTARCLWSAVRALLGRRALTPSSPGAGVPGCHSLNAAGRPFARGCRAFESPNRARRRVSRSSDPVMD